MADRDPYNFTNGECADKLEEYARVAKDCDPTPWPRAIIPYIERAVETLRNPPYREFIADADRAPLRRPNGRNDHGDLSLVRGGAGRAAPVVDDAMVRKLREAARFTLDYLNGHACINNQEQRDALTAALAQQPGEVDRG